MEDHPLIRLKIAPELSAVLDKRRLKEADICNTIFQAEQTGQKFVHPHTGNFLAGVRPYFVTVWVEYRPLGDGYEVLSAYQHRVKITGGTSP